MGTRGDGGPVGARDFRSAGVPGEGIEILPAYRHRSVGPVLGFQGEVRGGGWASPEGVTPIRLWGNTGGIRGC